ncbi:MAG TPA: hypothetical protein DDY31_02855 [Lachnospiraceae bacterium]|nr:hypothetical protein [Lachnospiraceae bacterium]
MIEIENKKVLNLFTGMLVNHLESKCSGQLVPSAIEKVKGVIESNVDMNSNNIEDILQDHATLNEMEDILQECGLSSEILQELLDESPELLKSVAYIVEYFDSQFRVLQDSILTVQKQMHMDKVSKYESIYVQVDKKKNESNVGMDEWIRTIENLESALKALTGEIKINIEVCNKAPKSINLRELFQFLRNRQVSAKQIKESLQILQEDLSLYEKGIIQMFELELYYENRIKSAKKTLQDAIDFLTQWFNGEEENMMYILTGDDFWVENPKKYCNTLHDILQRIDTKLLEIKN